MDSAMVSAACRRLARISIMHLTLRGMAEEIQNAGLSDAYGDMLNKYVNTGDSDDISYRLKGDEARVKMEEILKDAVIILERAKERFGGTEAYRKVHRMVEEQSKVNGAGARELKDGKEIRPTSMQTPYDGDATYRKKSGKQYVGYALNVVESCGENANVIEDYDLQPNTYSDEQFAGDVLAGKQKDGGTETMAVDGAYCSTGTFGMAEEKGIDLSSPTMIGGVKDDFELGFEFDEQGNIIKCPAGHKPNSSKYVDGKHIGYFDAATCEGCKYCDRCPGSFQKKHAKIEVTDASIKKAELAKRKNNDDSLTKNARKRNGIEGVFSVLRRKYLIDRIPARGTVRKKLWTGFKIGAMNFMNLINANKKVQRCT